WCPGSVFRRDRSFGLSLRGCLSQFIFHPGNEIGAGDVLAARRLDKPHKWKHSVGLSPGLLTVREAGQAPEATPIGGAAVAAELRREPPRSCSAELFSQRTGVLYPSLEISWRRFDHQRRREAGSLHSLDRRCREIVH